MPLFRKIWKHPSFSTAVNALLYTLSACVIDSCTATLLHRITSWCYSDVWKKASGKMHTCLNSNSNLELNTSIKPIYKEDVIEEIRIYVWNGLMMMKSIGELHILSFNTVGRPRKGFWQLTSSIINDEATERSL